MNTGIGNRPPRLVVAEPAYAPVTATSPGLARLDVIRSSERANWTLADGGPGDPRPPKPKLHMFHREGDEAVCPCGFRKPLFNEVV